MSTGVGIFLIVIGAILLFALTAGSPRWLNLHIVGIILILAGVLGMVLPRLRRGGKYPDLMSRWVMPGQFPANGPRAAGHDQTDYDGPPMVRELSDDDPPTLADEILSLEHDAPL